jgi:hypothetical protein
MIYNKKFYLYSISQMSFHPPPSNCNLQRICRVEKDRKERKEEES